jgi:hypothetical protein
VTGPNGRANGDPARVIPGHKPLATAESEGVPDLPVLLAGGGFKHRGHVSYGTGTGKPLCNLYVRMLRQLGAEAERFGSSTGTVEDIG